MKDTLNQKLLLEKVEFLEHKFDSILNSNHLIQLEYKLNEKQELMNQVNDFYDSAWIKLLIVISILGIIIPVLVQLFQRKSLKDLTEFIRKQMNDNFDNRIKELKEFNKTSIDKTLLDIKNDLASLETRNLNLMSEVEASLFYLQGRTFLIDKNYIGAFGDFIRSSYDWLNSEKPDRSIVTFNNAITSLKKSNKPEDFDEINERLKRSSFNKTIDEMIEYFDNHKYVEIYKDKLEIMKTELERLKNIG